MDIHAAVPFQSFSRVYKFRLQFWPSSTTRYSVDFRLLSWLTALLVKSKFMFSLAYFGDSVAQLKLIKGNQHHRKYLHG